MADFELEGWRGLLAFLALEKFMAFFVKGWWCVFLVVCIAKFTKGKM